MKIILKENIEKLGKAGEVVNVSDGYARNYLLPGKKVLEASPQNLKQVAVLQKAHAARTAREKQEAESLAKKLNSLSLTISAKAGKGDRLFGAVTSQDIGEAIQNQGLIIDRRKIQLKEPLRTAGIFEVFISLHPEVKASVKVQILPETTEKIKKTKKSSLKKNKGETKT